MKEVRPALLLLLMMSLLCGGLYPAIVTGLAQLLFPAQANGSLLTAADGRVVGSSLIGQPFSDPQYLWPRPSATGVFPYNPLASGGSNLSPAGASHRAEVSRRVQHLHSTGIQSPIAADLVQASGSGLDPHISPQAADMQIPRIAKARRLHVDEVASMVTAHTEGPQFGFLGASRVNVLAVNLALDRAYPVKNVNN